MHHTQAERTRRYRATPKGIYNKHKCNAHARGVEFQLTFDEWWNLWRASGHWAKRGNRKGRYCMCRFGDEGPYVVGNVYIGTWSGNVAERNRTVVAKSLKIAKTIENAKDAPF